MKLFLILLLTNLFIVPVVSAQSGDYPGRAMYPNANVWETDKLNQEFENVTIIDVRSKYEFDTLHINNAINIPLSDHNFVAKVAAARDPVKPVVFYCNGHTCFKSYKAFNKASNGGIDNTFSYDSGVFDWVTAHPEKTTLLGKTPVDTRKLITKDQLADHSLDPDSFSAKITKNTVILDIREASQRGLMELFPYRQENIELDDLKKMDSFLNNLKKSGQPLLVYDEAGKQVRWLQYYLEDKGIKQYNFMKGGIKQYFKNLRGS